MWPIAHKQLPQIKIFCAFTWINLQKASWIDHQSCAFRHGLRMVVFSFICHNQHGWIIQRTFHMLSCWATSYAATLVVPSWMRWALYRFLPIFSPRIFICWDICHLGTDCWHFDGSFHPRFPALGTVTSSWRATVLATIGIIRLPVAFLLRRRQWRPTAGWRKRCQQHWRSFISRDNAPVASNRWQERIGVRQRRGRTHRIFPVTIKIGCCNMVGQSHRKISDRLRSFACESFESKLLHGF